MGITAEHAEELREALLEAAEKEEATPTDQDQYGQRFVVELYHEWTGRRGPRAEWLDHSRGRGFSSADYLLRALSDRNAP